MSSPIINNKKKTNFDFLRQAKTIVLAKSGIKIKNVVIDRFSQTERPATGSVQTSVADGTAAVKPKGFTIMEIIVVAGISSLILLAVGVFILGIFRTYRTLDSALASNEQASRALNNIIKELRPAGASSGGAYPIAEATASSITFYTNLDQDNLIEKVRYFIAGDTLRRGVTKPTGNPLTYQPSNEVIVNVVQNLINSNNIFAYYSASYNGSSPPLAFPVNITDIRLVKISFIIDKNPAEPPAPYYLSGEVNLRNLKDNL